MNDGLALLQQRPAYPVLRLELKQRIHLLRLFFTATVMLRDQ